MEDFIGKNLPYILITAGVLLSGALLLHLAITYEVKYCKKHDRYYRGFYCYFCRQEKKKKK